MIFILFIVAAFITGSVWWVVAGIVLYCLSTWANTTPTARRRRRSKSKW